MSSATPKTLQYRPKPKFLPNFWLSVKIRAQNSCFMWKTGGGYFQGASTGRVPGVEFQKFFLILYLYSIHHILSCEKVKKSKKAK